MSRNPRHLADGVMFLRTLMVNLFLIRDGGSWVTDHPAVTDERGIVSLPPDPLPKVAAGVALAAGVAWGLSRTRTAGRA